MSAHRRTTGCDAPHPALLLAALLCVAGSVAGCNRPAAGTGTPATPDRAGYAFPVEGPNSYERDHHDYPATDVMAPCDARVVAVTSGTVLTVSRADDYRPEVNAGDTRGGLSVSLLGDDGVRYYGSHLSSVDAGIEPGVRLAAGQPLGRVGRTGDASACHLHFGISPPCDRTDDWWIRRGVVWPWPYLDSWRSGGARSAADEIANWQAANGCPAGPPVDP